MIRLPDIPAFQATPINAPGMRAAAAAAPAAALGDLGEALVGVSHHFADTANQLQKLENGRVVSEKRNQLAQDFAAHQIALQKDPDPVSRITRTRDFLSDYKGKLTEDTMPPLVRAELSEHFDHFASQAVIAQGEDSARLGLQRAGQALKNEYSGGLDRNDPAAVEQAIRTGQASGAILPEEADGMRVRAKESFQNFQAEREIAGNPKEWQSRNPAETIPDGVKPETYRQQQNFAKGQLRDRQLGSQEAILNGIADGSIDTHDKIAAAGGDLGAADVADLQQRLALRGDAAEKQRLARPEVQAQNIGRISAAISELQPDDIAGQVAIQRQLTDLPTGEIKNELNTKFSAAIKGETVEAKTYGEMVMGQIDALHTAGRFGQRQKPDPLATAKLVKDGFLKDPAKLQRLGFAASAAEKIAAAAATDPAAGQKKFIDLWKDRAQGSVNASAIELATADALRNGHATLSGGWDDPASKVASDAANYSTAENYGMAKMKMAQFLKLNPQAPQKEIDAKFREITGEAVRRQAKQGLVEPRPGWIDPSTSMNLPKGGVKLANYGYPSDRTPDNNSKKGIGDHDNRMIAGQSAAISKSLADRLGLSHGDKLKIETTKGDFTVFYHDTVPSTDSRTGDLPETIDIYRPKDGSNDWSGRVTKVSKI